MNGRCIKGTDSHYVYGDEYIRLAKYPAILTACMPSHRPIVVSLFTLSWEMERRTFEINVTRK